MNIFYLDNDPAKAAKDLVDKHIVKMPLESAQMLSTVHRLLDGQTFEATTLHKKKVLHLLPGETWNIDSNDQITIENQLCYKVAHAKHPSTVWTMQSHSNYKWHVELFSAMLKEFSARYGKIHSSQRLLPFLSNLPKNIPIGDFTPPTPAMPEKYKTGDSLQSYRRYYAGDKWRFAKWKHQEIPMWIPGYMHQVWNEDVKAFSEQVSNIAQKYGNRKNLPMDGRIFQLGNHILHEAISNIQNP